MGRFMVIGFLMIVLRATIADAVDSTAVTNVVVATGITRPTDIQSARDGSGRLFLVQQTGLIKILSGTNVLATPFLDVSGLITTAGNEQGLLGLAFHPGYRTNGWFFVDFTRSSDGATVVRRYTVSGDPNVADTDSGTNLLVVAQPYSNHNAGQLQFGQDGYLYVALGDGGSGCDPGARAQNLNEYLGKLLRLDVNHGLPYTVPADNPFVGGAGLDEIWAYGLRNPWRFSFDRQTGELIIADVGQSQSEEIDFQPVTSPGGENYGWRYYEGTLTNTCSLAATNYPYVLPVLEYGHTGGRCSITGGYRYRGLQVPALSGYYLYADYCSGEIFAAIDDTNGVWSTELLRDEVFNITTFGEDEAGEIYYGDRSNNRILKLVPVDTDADGLPDWWEQMWFGSTTGAVANVDSDGDGYTNGQERLAGTSPTDPTSALQITEVTAVGDVYFTTEPTKRYSVERTDDLTAPGSWVTFTNNLVGTGALLQVNDPTVVGQPHRFYRVRLQP